jgi:hypothetical protein
MAAAPSAAAASQMHTIAGTAISITANATARTSQCQNAIAAGSYAIEGPYLNRSPRRYVVPQQWD